MFRPSLCHSLGFPRYLVHRSPHYALSWAKSVRPILPRPNSFVYFLILSSLYEKCLQWCLRCVSRLPARTVCSALLTALRVFLTKTVVCDCTATIQWNLQNLAVCWCPVNTQHTLPATITSPKIFSKVQVLWSAVRRWALLTYPLIWEWNFTCLLVTE